ncbi:uncharacterized protein A4U43_C07F19000 [Asparagus officinalis]|uniref:Uncharacterized protein n=1 Tax=Asparagus officinalis TaxID=4686 RepID=A0A5P1EDE9_ASPOF|nr:uncharacterized protein A4U43_C07F19000 [Asparagus officinalis]
MVLLLPIVARSRRRLLRECHDEKTRHPLLMWRGGVGRFAMTEEEPWGRDWARGVVGTAAAWSGRRRRGRGVVGVVGAEVAWSGGGSLVFGVVRRGRRGPALSWFQREGRERDWNRSGFR